MSLNGASGMLGGVLGVALGLYVVHEITKDGKTGRRLGTVRAKSERHAIKELWKRRSLPRKVRTFKRKAVKISYKNSNGSFGESFNVTMPRLF